MRDLLEVYTTVVRAVPELVWILLLYFAGSDLINQMLELAMVENLQRQDLDAMERATGYRQMADSLGLTQEEVAALGPLSDKTVRTVESGRGTGLPRHTTAARAQSGSARPARLVSGSRSLCTRRLAWFDCSCRCVARMRR